MVREALGYSEFVEALLLLYEDKQGVKQHEKTFDLPEELPRDDWEWWHDATDEPEPNAAPTSPLRPTATAAAASSPMRTSASAGGGERTGMSPTRLPPRAGGCHLALSLQTSTSSAWRTVSSLGCYVDFVFYKAPA